MNMPQSAKYILGVAAAAALLAGCSSGSTSSSFAPASAPTVGGASKLMHNGHVISTSVLDPKIQVRKSNGMHMHPLHGKIDARTKTFWISDAVNNDVEVFGYPSGTAMGTLAAPPEGFSEPQGMCSDKNGNVFVANTNNSTIDEYAPDGSFTQALSDPNEFPAGCAVDPKSGTLAVSNIISTSDNAGGISLYTNATGTPQQLTDPNMFEVFFPAYLGKTGNLYYSGFNNSFYAAVSSYIGGNFALLNISGATIGFPGTVSNAFKTGTLAIGDQDTFYGPTFYQVTAAGNVTGTTVISCPSGDCDVVQATVKGNKIVAPDAGSIDATVNPYPAGGDALVTVTGFGQPIGSAVSSSL
jgi:hypothetical protein